MPLEHVQQALSISYTQALALVRSGQLRAIKVGCRGQWRVSLDALEEYIAARYAATAAMARTEGVSLAPIEKGQLLGGHGPSPEALARASRVLAGETSAEDARAELEAKYGPRRARSTPDRLPAPVCEYGYPLAQLVHILGEEHRDSLREFSMMWASYSSPEHGHVIYVVDAERYLSLRSRRA